MPKIRTKMAWSKRQAIPDASVLDAAVQFHDGCHVLWKALLNECGVLLPFMNSAAMSIELYLKSLAAELKWVPQEDGVSIVYSVPARGHEPTKLLTAIPDDVRVKLAAAFVAWKGSNGQKIEERCATYDKLFMDSRYVFEEGRKLGGVTLESLVAFIDFLKGFVTSYPPEERIYV